MSNILTINFTTPKISEQIFRYCPSQPDEDPSAFPLQILKTTSYWDFSLDKDRKPRCSHELRSLIDSVVSGGDR